MLIVLGLHSFAPTHALRRAVLGGGTVYSANSAYSTIIAIHSAYSTIHVIITDYSDYTVITTIITDYSAISVRTIIYNNIATNATSCWPDPRTSTYCGWR